MTTESGAAVVEIRPVDDFSGLAETWLDLETRADCSFFQSWAWTGCLAEERFDDPWLLEAKRGGRTVALALFNRARRHGLVRPLLLGESGRPSLDSIFVEHNGLLVDRAEPDALRALCWAELAKSEPGRGAWVLSGMPAAALHDLPRARIARIVARRPAPYLDLAGVGAGRGLDDILGVLSANTRQQLRRSLRAWEAMGPLRLDVARSADEAEAFLEALKDLHQRYWIGRGKPGAFAEPFFERFHRALLRRAAPDQRLDLIRVSAGERVAGYLYNFVHRDRVCAYQSGFDFGADSDRLRPGLVCHLLAIARYAGDGLRFYDFLGGDARYKRSFANGEAELIWFSARQRLVPRFARASG